MKARAAEGSRILNPLPLVEWNIDKFYLRDLHDKGIATLPTKYIPRGGITVGLRGSLFVSDDQGGNIFRVRTPSLKRKFLTRL